MSRQYMLDRWCVRCGRTTPTPYTLKTIQWRRKAMLPVRSVLDVGCGNGRNLHAFQIGTSAKRLVGFDLCTDRAKNLCQAHVCRKVRLRSGILGRDELPKGKFDIVLLNYSLMFLDRDERRKVLSEAYDRLARGGWLVIEMYPAKDSECPTNEDCENVIELEVLRVAADAVVFRRSKNRVIVERTV